MDRVYVADRRGTPILHVDYSWLQDPEELRAIVRQASARVRREPPHSLLVLVNLTGVPHTLVIAAIMQEGVAESRPHVRARAVIGLSSDAAGSFDVAAKLFGRPMARFDDEEAALDWLLNEAC